MGDYYYEWMGTIMAWRDEIVLHFDAVVEVAALASLTVSLHRTGVALGYRGCTPVESRSCCEKCMAVLTVVIFELVSDSHWL